MREAGLTRRDVQTNRFADKVAMVTGAGSGMGAAIARQLAAEGARAVVLADVNGDGAAAVARNCRPLGRSHSTWRTVRASTPPSRT